MTMLLACVKEPWEYRPEEEKGETLIRIDFSNGGFDYLATKSALGYAEESRIFNMMVFIFNSSGSKVYGKWFDSATRKDSESELVPDSWYVENSSSAASNTHGAILLKGPSGSGHCIYVLANLDADMVKLSSDYLQNKVHSIDELKAFEVEMNQETVYRNGYFPMSGFIEDIDKSSGLRLQRLDAKINFVFKSTAATFEAEQWKVVNVPKTSYVMERENEDSHSVPPTAQIADYQNYAPYFFDTDWINFEEYPDNESAAFTFYMLENRMSPKGELSSFADRDRRLKDDRLNAKTMLGDRELLLFDKANDFSTYVLVRGKVWMNLENDSAGQILGADVQYLIHLGDWASNNFITSRNTEYNYTVTINSVNNIRVEVESSNSGPAPIENQPGASGVVTVAKEQIALCDAHFVSKPISFHARNLLKINSSDDGLHNYQDLSQSLTWRVSTPFSTGQPSIEDGVDIPTGLDYKWVHFRLNKMSDGSYLNTRREYCSPDLVFELNPADNSHNDGLMDVIALVKFIKAQTAGYCEYLNNGGTNTSLFDNPDRLLNPDGSFNEGPDAPKISITVFVDEFYYDKDPLSGNSSPTLWKSFVNTKDRSIQILSSSDSSADLESVTTASVVSIQQKSIQSVYNTDPAISSLVTAWGIENEDENEFAKRDGAYWTYSPGTIASSTRNSGNNSDFNGRLNSIKEFDLWDNASGSFKSGQAWSDYMDFETDKDTPQLNRDHSYLRYSCMSRNRDNNGNGIIEEDEIVWYAAADKQLLGIYMGDAVLNSRTKLYNPLMAQSDTAWMQHIVSSTQFPGEKKSDSPTVFWAEEGVSTSSLYSDKELWKTSNRWTVRCVRNLGLPADDPALVPQDYIVHNEEQPLFFDISYLNPSCQRYYTSRELDFHFENSTENRVYRAFEAYPEDTPLGGNYRLNSVMNDDKSLKISCPEGYRFPNQRELAIMRDYLGVKKNGGMIENSISRTASSIGYYSSHPRPGKENAYGFALINSGAITIGADASFVRCVRDLRQ